MTPPITELVQMLRYWEKEPCLPGPAASCKEAADLLEQQADRIAALEAKCRLYEASLDKADKEVDRLRKDADRYRWLRDSSHGQFEHPIVTSQHRTEIGMRYVGPLSGKALDAGIDAALSQSTGEKSS